MSRGHALIRSGATSCIGRHIPEAFSRSHIRAGGFALYSESSVPVSAKVYPRTVHSLQGQALWTQRQASSIQEKAHLTVRSVSAEAASMAESSKIQLYSLGTPNGKKIGIALEEMELPYEPHTINIMKGDQHTPEFLKINPNGKIPAIVDPNGPGGKPLAIFESGAILLYLAEKSGKFLSTDPVLRWETIQWLFFQVGGVGPMFGQFGAFFRFLKEKCDHPLPLERYSTESKRLLGVLEQRLEGREFLIDSGYSIADMATFPWVQGLKEFYKADDQLELSKFPKVFEWVERCASRPLTAKGMKVTPFSVS